MNKLHLRSSQLNISVLSSAIILQQVTQVCLIEVWDIKKTTPIAANTWDRKVQITLKTPQWLFQINAYCYLFPLSMYNSLHWVSLYSLSHVCLWENKLTKI